jgi:hypothetical protein
MAQACNPSYSGGGNLENPDSRPSWVKIPSQPMAWHGSMGKHKIRTAVQVSQGIK